MYILETCRVILVRAPTVTTAGRSLIERYGYTISGYHLEDSSCPYCKTHIDGVEMEMKEVSNIAT